MAIEFDYDSEMPDVDTVAAVAGEMTGKPQPPSDEEREQLRAWREQQEWLAEHQRRERERRQAEAETERTMAEKAEAAILRARERDRLNAEMREQSNRQMRDAQLASLHRASLEQQQFRNAALLSARFAAQRQILESALSHFSPPPPPPEPAIVDDDPMGSYFGERGFSVEAWSKRKGGRSWW